MRRKNLFLAFVVMLVALATSSRAQAWGGCHFGYHAGGFGGFRYGGGYHYGGYGYGGYGGGAYHYGYHSYY